MVSRRELLACLAAGGAITASGLWWPNRKLISIPSGKVFSLAPVKCYELWARDTFGESLGEWHYVLLGPGEEVLIERRGVTYPYTDLRDGPDIFTVSTHETIDLTQAEYQRLLLGEAIV